MMKIKIPPRSEYERRTAAAYDAVAEEMTRKESEHPLVLCESALQIRARMVDDPLTLCLGCGSGREIPLLGELGVKRIVGIDFSKELIRIAKTRFPECDFRVGDILRLEEVVGKEKFDAFWAITTLMCILPEHMPQAVGSIRRAMKTGAVGFISVPHGRKEELIDAHEVDRQIPRGRHFMLRNTWDPNKFARLVLAAGFDIINPELDPRMINLTVRAV